MHFSIAAESRQILATTKVSVLLAAIKSSLRLQKLSQQQEKRSKCSHSRYESQTLGVLQLRLPHSSPIHVIVEA